MADSTFEARLRARLHDVIDSQTGPHPVWAEAPAARRTSERQRRGRWPIRLLAVAALIAIGGGAITLVGSLQRQIDDAPPSPNLTAPTIPELLRGQFVAQLGSAPGDALYPFYFIDLEDAVLVHGPSTTDDPAEIRADARTEADWAGRLVLFMPANAGSATVIIKAPLPCGEGRYLVQYDEAELSFTQPQDRCADRLAILTARAWTHQATRLVSGEQYSSWSFTEPFHFVMPAVPPGSPQVTAKTWLAPGRLKLGSPWWFGEVYDDWKFPIDGCDPGQGSLSDVPSSPQTFESWLKSNDQSIDEVVEIDVDGRVAMRYATVASSCPGEDPNTFGSRWYLIPTGEDTILINVYGDTATELQVADELVRSITFD